MGIHKKAVLTPTGREILVRRVVDEGQRPLSVGTDMGVSLSTVRKWVGASGPRVLRACTTAHRVHTGPR